VFVQTPENDNYTFIIYMDKKNNQELYTCPKADVMEFKTNQMICQSQQLFEENDGEWN